jgi:hypothetical protein
VARLRCSHCGQRNLAAEGLPPEHCTACGKPLAGDRGVPIEMLVRRLMRKGAGETATGTAVATRVKRA